jgi:hypothetical protein
MTTRIGGWDRESGRSGTEAKVGGFGCPANGGRIVRCFWPGSADGTPPPRRVAVDPCPNCGYPHPLAAIVWRKPSGYDLGREPDLVVTPDRETAR